MADEEKTEEKKPEVKEEKKEKKHTKKGKKPHKNKLTSKKYKFYDDKGKKLDNAKFCPRCGPGVFLADMGNRFYCGKCGYAEFNKSENKSSEKHKIGEAK